ncbi:MAG TPA: nuclear transport factor 2 family protein [Pseudomonadales bacterium]|nr:nuclear transport factor 2 family protein [Pseudomonadales bacterium]
METAVLQNAVAQYIEAFEKADLGIIENIFAVGATVEDPVGTPQYVGIEAIKAFYKSAFDMGVKLELNGKPRCAGNSVAFSFDVVMTGMKISPIDVFELNADGKVQSMKAYWGPENMG